MHERDGRTATQLRAESVKMIAERKANLKARVDDGLSDDLKPFVEQARDKGASSWLNALPIREQQLDLSKDEFRDALRLRYNLPLQQLPSTCACGQPFNVNHALSCKKGGFVTRRHDNVKDFLTVLLDKTCVDVQAEPHLSTITTEQMRLKTANTEDESRLDIKARGFWRRGQTAFFDVRITHVNSASNRNLSTAQVFSSHEQTKKRAYLERVLEVEHGSFTPLGFGTNGGMGDECKNFVATLASKIAVKQGDTYSAVISWIRTRLSFEILRSALLCVRGSRVPFRKVQAESITDIQLSNVLCDLH